LYTFTSRHNNLTNITFIYLSQCTNNYITTQTFLPKQAVTLVNLLQIM